MKKAYWAGAALIVAFLLLGLTTFSSSMTPYVTFDEALSSPRVCQVMGGLEKGSSKYDTTTQTLRFNLVDLESKKVLPVTYVVGGFLLIGGVVLILADIISPVKIF